VSVCVRVVVTGVVRTSVFGSTLGVPSLDEAVPLLVVIEGTVWLSQKAFVLFVYWVRGLLFDQDPQEPVDVVDQVPWVVVGALYPALTRWRD
jgi:hypothetical protein